MKELCLVSASGGLDSSVTLAILKLAGYENIVACHFKYGHRGQNCEQLAIDRVCEKLNIPRKVFDLTSIYQHIDQDSMLTNPESEITTGTADGLKTVAAWTNGRNMMFITVMAAFAESQVMKNNYDKVYFLGGFLNLSESGIYPDNSELFLDSCLNMFKFGTLIGNRIKPLYGLSNLMKYEHFVLIKHFHLEDVYRCTISCDRPMIFGSTNVMIPHNCMKDGIPACGSGLLSYWGAKMAGMDDMKLRNFYEVDDPSYKAYIPDHMKSNIIKHPNIHEIIDRILLPEDKLNNLRMKLKKGDMI